MQETKHGIAAAAASIDAKPKRAVIDMKKNIMMGGAPSEKAASSKKGGEIEDDFDEEYEHMMQGKTQMQMREAKRRKVEKKVINMEKRQQKLNTQLIEMFAKKEL